MIPKIDALRLDEIDIHTLKTIKYLQKANEWDSKLQVLKTDTGEFWSPQYKGRSFEKRDDLIVWCFLCWCRQNTIELA